MRKVCVNPAGTDMTCTITPTGEMKDVKFSEGAVKKFKALPGGGVLGAANLGPDSFKSLVGLVAHSKEAVEKGKTWTQKGEAKTSIGKTTNEMKMTYEGQFVKNGRKFDQIAIKPKIEV